jgi:hypothetical protein
MNSSPPSADHAPLLEGLMDAPADGLAIVTVCMNRFDHLRLSAAAVARWPGHREHLIVDWSSAIPVRRSQLPPDPRIRLLRVEAEPAWTLCRAYNFAIARSGHPWILKLDADTWPTEAFDMAALRLEPGSGYAFGCGPMGRKGQFLMARQLFAAVGGFHEGLAGYGFDDKDLQARLAIHTGGAPLPIPETWIGVIPHTDAERAGQSAGSSRSALERSRGLAAMRASRLGNRLLAAHCPWSGRATASHYRELDPGVWQVDPASLPRPPAEVADEVDHARRLTFWGCFLAIPEVFLAELPIKLVPPCIQGHWRVRWWHRLWWHSGRRLLQLPILLLSLGHGRLEGLRALLGRRQPTS